jgi:hypothetical protein
LIGPIEDQQIKPDVHHHPAERRNCLDDEIGREHQLAHEAVARERKKNAKVGWMF